jgi:hypothetical protein
MIPTELAFQHVTRNLACILMFFNKMLRLFERECLKDLVLLSAKQIVYTDYRHTHASAHCWKIFCLEYNIEKKRKKKKKKEY